MKRDEEKAVECYSFLPDPLFCWPFIRPGAYLCLGAVVPIQYLKTNGSKGGQGSISSCNSGFYMGLKFWTGRAWWASSCCSGACGLVYSETHALVAMSSEKLSVSQPCFLALRPAGIEWAAPMLLSPEKQGGGCQTPSGGLCLWWFPESGVCLVGSWPAWGRSVLGPPEQSNSGSSSVPVPGNRPWHVSFHRHNMCLPPMSLFPAKAVSSNKN